MASDGDGDGATRSVVVPNRGGARVRFPRARLLVEEGPDQGREFPLPERELVLGRGGDAAIRLADAAVSRAHLLLRPEGAGWVFEDLGSRSGVRVNGEPAVRGSLEDGDRITLGETALVFHLRREEAAAEAEGAGDFFGMTAASFEMRRLFGLVRRLAPMDVSVLLQGETGTGKELLARALHDATPGAGRPYVVVDCALLAGEHVRSELFGHVRGAFTGAQADRVGAFAAADGGTLFLDEVGELPLDVQPALLRALERGEVRPLGASAARKVAVRVVSATHRDLDAMVAAGDFRRDLLFRLSAVRLAIPPLRARPGDPSALAARFLPAGARLSADAAAYLATYPWPGNVRQLRAILAVAAELRGSLPIRRTDLEALVAAGEGGGAAGSGSRSAEEAPGPGPEGGAAVVVGDASPLSAAEDAAARREIRQALAATGGALGAAAKRLGISRSTLYRRVRRLGLDGEAPRGPAAAGEDR